MAAELTIKVVSGASESLSVAVADLAQATVLSLKQLVEQQDPQRFPVAAQRLIFQGQILRDDALLADYRIETGCAIHLTLTRSAAAPAARPAAAAAPAAAAPAPAPTAPTQPPVVSQLRGFLAQMQSYEPPAQYSTTLQTLQRICENIVSHPTEDKYRKLRAGNAALKNKVFDRTRGLDCVKLLGFQDGVEEVHHLLTTLIIDNRFIN